jgi:hypothetical protein
MWSYVEQNTYILTPEELERGRWATLGKSCGVDGKKAIALGKRLMDHVRRGVVERYTKLRLKLSADFPDLPCDFCHGTGCRVPDGAYIPEPCSACNGLGHKRPWNFDRPLNPKHVKAFAKFCVYSGGF